MGNPQFKIPINLTDPSSIFILDNKVSDNLNNFQLRYSRYVRCQDSAFSGSVNDPPCDMNGGDRYMNLEKSYIDLLSAIRDVSNAYQNQSLSDAVSPPKYDAEYEELIKNYSDVVYTRNGLDEKLKRLYDEYSGGTESAKTALGAAMYANTLWTILATILIYFVFVKL
jgi:hypothetical protein